MTDNSAIGVSLTVAFMSFYQNPVNRLVSGPTGKNPSPLGCRANASSSRDHDAKVDRRPCLIGLTERIEEASAKMLYHASGLSPAKPNGVDMLTMSGGCFLMVSLASGAMMDMAC